MTSKAKRKKRTELSGEALLNKQMTDQRERTINALESARKANAFADGVSAVSVRYLTVRDIRAILQCGETFAYELVKRIGRANLPGMARVLERRRKGCAVRLYPRRKKSGERVWWASWTEGKIP